MNMESERSRFQEGKGVCRLTMGGRTTMTTSWGWNSNVLSCGWLAMEGKTTAQLALVMMVCVWFGLAWSVYVWIPVHLQ